MKTVYACTWIEKEVEKDIYEKGCVGEIRCVMRESVNIVSISLAKLLDKVGNQFGLKIDDVFIPDDKITYISFDRTEDGDGNEPSLGILKRWKCGEVDLWSARYFFGIEKRTVASIALQEISAAGIKIHS